MKMINKITGLTCALVISGCSSMVITKPAITSIDKHKHERGLYYDLPRGTVKIVGSWNSGTGLWDFTATTVYAADPDCGRYLAKRNGNIFFDSDLTLAIDTTTGLLTTANGTTADQSVNGVASLAAAASASFSLPSSFGAVASAASNAKAKSLAEFSTRVPPATPQELDKEIKKLVSLWAKEGVLNSRDVERLTKDIACLQTPLSPEEDGYLTMFLQRDQDGWMATASAKEIAALQLDQVKRLAHFSLFESFLDPFDKKTADGLGVVYHSAFVLSPMVSNQAAYARFDMIATPQNPPPHSPQQIPTGPFFSSADIRDLPGLARRILNGRDATSILIYKNMDAKLQALLLRQSKTGDQDLRTALTEIFNNYVSSESFFHDAQYKSDRLPQKIRDLLATDPVSGPDLWWLNRWLLNTTYKNELSSDSVADGILVRDPLVYAITIRAHLWSTVNSQIDPNDPNKKAFLVTPWTYNSGKLKFDSDNSFANPPLPYLAYHQGVILPDLNHTHVLPLEREALRQTSTKVSLSNGMIQSREDTHQSLFNAIAGMPKTIITGIVPIGGGSQTGGGANASGAGAGAGTSSSGAGGGAGPSSAGASASPAQGAAGSAQSSSPPIQ